MLNYSWRDYGVRVGIWRLMEVMQKHGFRALVALNSDGVRHYPRIIEAWAGAGLGVDGPWRDQLDLIHAQPEAEERQIIRRVVDTIEQATGLAAARLAQPGPDGDRTARSRPAG